MRVKGKDHLSEERRSWNMSRVRSKDTKPEILVRQALHKQGYRFRLHISNLPGKPDIVLPKWKTVIFVNGCFWHRHKGCQRSTTPTSNRKFWTDKFDRNVKRDRKNKRALKRLGWKVLVVWECEADNSFQSIKALI